MVFYAILLLLTLDSCDGSAPNGIEPFLLEENLRVSKELCAIPGTMPPS